MEKENKKTIEIPFGAKDSELYKFEYPIPDGYEAEIKDGKVIVTKKVSKDERIRKAISYAICAAEHQDGTLINNVTKDEAFAYLEKQKEQKPVEWSDEDESYLQTVINEMEANKKEAREYEHKKYDTIILWLKSLRPQPHWNPSEEQIDALERAIIKMHTPDDISILTNLRDDLYKIVLNTK